VSEPWRARERAIRKATDAAIAAVTTVIATPQTPYSTPATIVSDHEVSEMVPRM